MTVDAHHPMERADELPIPLADSADMARRGQPAEVREHRSDVISTAKQILGHQP